MAEHKVVFESPAIDVLNKDFVFHVRKGLDKLGRLRISKGAIVFVPFRGGVRLQRKLNWDEFAELMMKRGRAVKK